MEHVRKATPADAPIIASLCREVIDELRPNRGGDIWSRYEAWSEPLLDEEVLHHLEDPEKIALIAMSEGAAVGYALADFRQLHDEQLILVVRDLYVVPGVREVGLGELLIDELMDLARKRGAVGIDALVLPGDRAAKNFFETHGMKARALLVHRSLADEDGTG